MKNLMATWQVDSIKGTTQTQERVELERQENTYQFPVSLTVEWKNIPAELLEKIPEKIKESAEPTRQK